jgi:hypothetical protein
MVRPPSAMRVVVATLLSMGASIAVDAGLVWLGTAMTPAITHYSHFRLFDYGTLTVVGVAAAGVAWAMVTRLVISPRPFFLRLAVVVTLALLLPDAWLLIRHEPPRAVAVLICMHLAIAVITYWVLVLVAPIRERDDVVADQRRTSTLAAPDSSVEKVEKASTSRVPWSLMMSAVVLEFVVGLVGMLYVPLERPNGWIARKGEALYLAHALLGGVLGLGALALVVVVLRQEHAPRLDRIGAITGLCGVVLGAIGGIVCYSHSLRLLGLAVMFVGISVAFFGYVIPLVSENSGMSRFENTGTRAADGGGLSVTE